MIGEKIKLGSRVGIILYKFMKPQTKKIIFWAPRILAIIFIAFLSLFSLDIFDMGLNPWSIVTGLFIHNIPSLILIGILIVAWRYEIVGAMAFCLAGLAYIFLILSNSNFQWYMLSWSMIIAGPAFAISILFYLGWQNKK